MTVAAIRNSAAIGRSRFRIVVLSLLTVSRLDDLKQVVDRPWLLYQPFMSLKCQSLPVRVHREARDAIKIALHLRERQDAELARSGSEDRHVPEPETPLLDLVRRRRRTLVSGDHHSIAAGHP